MRRDQCELGREARRPARHRLGLAIAAAALAAPRALVVPAAAQPAAASEPAAPPGSGPPPAIYEARAEAGGFTDSMSVPARFETFTPYSRSDAQNNASSGLHAVFYPGFLLSAAAFQQGFPPPPGTTETLFPQGPFDHQAEVLPLGQGPGGPGRFAGSSGKSSATGSSGEAHYGGFAPSPDFAIQFGQAVTSVSAATSAVRSAADVVLQHVHIGDALVIDSVVAKAEAVADGAPGGASNTGSVIFEGARLLGTPVVLTPDGLEIGGTAGALPPAKPVDDLLAQAGLSIRRLPDTRAASPDGTESRLELGGVEIKFEQPEREFAVGFVLGRVAVAARAVQPEPLDLDLPIEQPVNVPEPDAVPRLAAGDPLTPVVSMVPSEPAVLFVTRRIRIPATTVALPDPPAAATAPAATAAAPAATLPAATAAAAPSVLARRGDWSGITGLMVLAAPAAVILRRLLRGASAP